MLKNRTKDFTPFDMGQKPVPQNRLLLLLIWLVSFAATRKFHLHIEKRNMEEVKPPFLVFSTHQGFSDYYIAPLALFPYRANYVSDMEGFAAFSKPLYRAIGCIGKRRYVPDLSVVKNIQYAIKKKQSVVIFPESRHSNIGTTAIIPGNLGKLAKLMNVPVVTLSVQGSYLANPFWDEEHTRRVPMKAVVECICSQKELLELGESDIQNRIVKNLQYDEYKWQRENHIKIQAPNITFGIEKPLYQCRECEALEMESKDELLFCRNCQKVWEMDQYGNLISDAKQYFISEWYEWERRQVEKSIQDKKIISSYPVYVEALPNEKGFIVVGEGVLYMDDKKFTLSVAKGTYYFSHKSRESVQTEYNYRGKGACIVLSNRDCCYYIYGRDNSFLPTMLQFAGEYYHQIFAIDKK